jgi:hypothetical protein
MFAEGLRFALSISFRSDFPIRELGMARRAGGRMPDQEERLSLQKSRHAAGFSPDRLRRHRLCAVGDQPNGIVGALARCPMKQYVPLSVFPCLFSGKWHWNS